MIAGTSRSRTAVGAAAALAALVVAAVPAAASAATPASAAEAATVTSAAVASPQSAAWQPEVSESNWAGYVDVAKAGTTFRSMSAEFRVPTVKCTSSNSQASIWIGLDGKTDNTIEQLGLSTNCDLGTPVYQGWYEMFPKGTVYRGYYSHPGDLISLSVSYNYSNHQYSFVYDDKTNAASSFSIPAVCPAKYTCRNLDAEAIMEAAGGTNVSRFSKVTFSDTSIVTRTGKRGAFAASSLWNLTESFMQHTSISRPSDGGSVFSISYN